MYAVSPGLRTGTHCPVDGLSSPAEYPTSSLFLKKLLNVVGGALVHQNVHAHSDEYDLGRITSAPQTDCTVTRISASAVAIGCACIAYGEAGHCCGRLLRTSLIWTQRSFSVTLEPWLFAGFSGTSLRNSPKGFVE